MNAYPDDNPSISPLAPTRTDRNPASPVAPPNGTGSALPVIPGYEVLEVLGRGGMGIVYKARDGLKRLVALKMVLAGRHATTEERARLRAEAEAVARVQHPHVVQVFTSGEHDGCPYFVCEYVAGGSLAKAIGHDPQPPRDAARLVMLLARGVHAAHQCGIVHRDLKPGNVLLAPPAAWFKKGPFQVTLRTLGATARRRTRLALSH